MARRNRHDAVKALEEMSEVVFSATVEDAEGRFQEITITDNREVLYSEGRLNRRREPELLERTARQVDEFLWDVEGIVADWDRAYGERGGSEGAWHVVLELSRGGWVVSNGYGEWPETWDDFCVALTDFLEREFG